MSLSYAMLFYIHANEIFKMRLENHLKGFPVFQMDEMFEEKQRKALLAHFFWNLCIDLNIHFNHYNST